MSKPQSHSIHQSSSGLRISYGKKMDNLRVPKRRQDDDMDPSSDGSKRRGVESGVGHDRVDTGPRKSEVQQYDIVSPPSQHS